MDLLKVAKSYLRQAKARLEDAREAIPEANYPYAVRLSQECVELSLKAALKIVGIDYPKIHDVSNVVEEVRERYPDWFKTEISFLSQTSKILVRKREISLYGGEEAFLSPDEVIDRNDAEDAVIRAEKTFELCETLMTEFEMITRP